MCRSMKYIFNLLLVCSFLITISCDDTTSKPTSQLASPSFSLNAGLYNDILEIELNHENPQAQIYYTLDGSLPSENSQLYQEAILVVATTTIKAIAYHSSYKASEVNSKTFWLNLTPVQDPIFVTEPGTYYYEETIALECPTQGADIFYTLDGSQPSQESQKYEQAFLITESYTVKARAYKQYYPSSDIVTANYEITLPSVAVPTFTPSPGLYDLNQTVSLHSATQAAAIYYTIDGSQPTINSLLYNEPLYIDSSITIKAIAVKEDYLNSPMVAGQYIIEYQTVAAPEFSLEPGYYLGSQTVSIETATPAASIYYTLDSSQPSQASQLYTNPIEISEPTTIKAVAFKEFFYDSPIVSAEYKVYQEAVENPILDPPPGNYIGMQVVTLSCSTPGAQIYYTVNGTIPTESSYLYIAPLSISQTTVLNIRAFAPGYYPSEIQGSRYLIGNPAPNDFVFVEGGSFSNYTADVTISSFYISNHEITQADYYSTMGFWPDAPNGFGAYHPAYYLTWYEVVAYCNARSIEEGLVPCYNLSNWSCDYEATGYRLPTEMEWMYAAKGGNFQPETDYNTYAGTDNPNLLIDYAWYNMLANNSCYQVRGKLANQLGLYDMSGNVYEWCNDWYGNYSTENQTNPTGPETGDSKVIKGGAWNTWSDACKITSRDQADPAISSNNIGFRLVRRTY